MKQHKIVNIFAMLFIGAILIFSVIATYNSLFRIIPIYSATFTDEVTVSIPEDAYQKIKGDFMQIIVDRYYESEQFTGQINSMDEVFNFNLDIRKNGIGNKARYHARGWLSIPKSKKFTLKISPRTDKVFTLTVNYIK